MAPFTTSRKIVLVGLLGAMIAAAAITVAKGVEVWTMFGTTCIAGGCAAVTSGNQGGWFGIVAGVISYVFAGGIQSGQVKSGLRRRELYTPEQIGNGTFLKENLLHAGYANDDADSLVASIIHGTSRFSLQGLDYTVAQRPSGKVRIATPLISAKRDDQEYEAYIEQKVDLSYLDQNTQNEWANDIASSIVSNFGGNEAVCALIEEQSEQGGYAFAALQISQAGTDLQTDGSCDYANYDRRRAVNVVRRFVPEKVRAWGY